MNPVFQAFFAVQGPAAPAGRSSLAGRAIIVVCVIAAIAWALRESAKHFKCGGGCCGGGAMPPPVQEAKKIGAVVATRTIDIDGMHCMKCVSRVQAALDAIDGVSSDVSLEPQRAVVRMDREVSGEVLRKAVEDQGFTVRSIA